jgi:hypothetical protein
MATYTGPYEFSGPCTATIDVGASFADAGSAFTLTTRDGGAMAVLLIGFPTVEPTTGSYTSPQTAEVLGTFTSSMVGDSSPTVGSRTLDLEVSFVHHKTDTVITVHGTLDSTFQAIATYDSKDGGFTLASEHVTATF